MGLLDGAKDEILKGLGQKSRELGNELQKKYDIIKDDLEQATQAHINDAKKQIASVVNNINIVVNNAKKAEIQIKKTINSVEGRADGIISDIDGIIKEKSNEIELRINNILGESLEKLNCATQNLKDNIDSFNDTIQGFSQIVNDNINEYKTKAKEEFDKITETKVEEIMTRFVENNSLKLSKLMFKGLFGKKV